MKPTDAEIYKWLADQKYQTEYEETGEYVMYFSVDMPKILRAFNKWMNDQIPQWTNVASNPWFDMFNERHPDEVKEILNDV